MHQQFIIRSERIVITEIQEATEYDSDRVSTALRSHLRLKRSEALRANGWGEAPKIEFIRFLSLIPIIEALSTGAIDLAIGGTPVAAVASDLPIRILALTERSPKTHAILVRPDSDIKSIDDLKGKRIATPNGEAYFFPQKVLQSANIKSSEVNWVKIENDLGHSALLSGKIDAWATWDPFYASAEISKEAVPLVDGEKYHANYVVLMGNASGFAEIDSIVVFQPGTPNDGEFWIVNRNSGKLLEIAGNSTADGALATQWDDTGYPCQLWSFQPAGSGYYRIVNKNSGKLLEVIGASTADGASVGQWGDTGHHTQQWSINPTDSGYFKLINRNSGKLLEVFQMSTANGATVTQWGDTGYPCQEWTQVKEGIQ